MALRVCCLIRAVAMSNCRREFHQAPAREREKKKTSCIRHRDSSLARWKGDGRAGKEGFRRALPARDVVVTPESGARDPSPTCQWNTVQRQRTPGPAGPECVGVPCRLPSTSSRGHRVGRGPRRRATLVRPLPGCLGAPSRDVTMRFP